MRRARPADAARLTRIAHAAKAYWRYPAAWLRLWRADLTVTPAFIADHPVYCATRGAAIVGFYAVSGSRTTRELDHMWVHPRHVGRGIGRVLFADLVRRLRRLGVRRLQIVSDPHAEGFYRHMGATRVGRARSRPAGRFLPVLVLRLPPTVAA
jgi:GNAT superfamily N-acetyltransferase